MKSPPGIFEITEISLRADIADLWKLYRELDTVSRTQFLQAAAKWQEALMHWQDRPSLSFTLMVIACEILKPLDADYRQNCYDVIETLLGKAAVDEIREKLRTQRKASATHTFTMVNSTGRN